LAAERLHLSAEGLHGRILALENPLGTTLHGKRTDAAAM